MSNNHVGPRHYDVGRLTVTESTPNIPSYSTTHPDWVGPNQTVTYTAYGTDWVAPPNSGKKQYQHFSIIDSATFAALTPHDEAAASALYARHMLASPSQKPFSSIHDEGAPVFMQIGASWKIIGILPAEDDDTTFVRYGNIRNWLAQPAVNQFQDGFRGFIFNRVTGRCIGARPSLGGSDAVWEAECDGRLQDNDRQSWRLVAWGSVAGSFQLVNGGTGTCLESVLDPGAPVTLKHKPCVVPGVGTPAQRWTFPELGLLTLHRQLSPGTGGCALPSSTQSPGPVIVTACSGNTNQQMWTMTR
jgi:hypothetical protein